MPPGWVLSFPLFLLLLRPPAVAGRLLPAAGRLPTVARRSHRIQLVAKVRARAEGSSVVKRIKVQKGAV
jgi:hypothetical protein